MVEPFSVVGQFAFEPFWKLPEVIDELSIQVLNAPLNLALVLRIRRMRKMSFNAMQTAPFLPFLLELRSMIRENRLRKPLLLLQNTCHLIRRQLMLKLFR
jgi:hypothetical protein